MGKCCPRDGNVAGSCSSVLDWIGYICRDGDIDGGIDHGFEIEQYTFVTKSFA